MNNQRYVVIDVETTGNSPKKGDKIIQIAAVVIENGQMTERFSKYVNPNQPIPAFIEQLTGISNEMVENEEPFSAIAEDIFKLLHDSCFIAHNIHFDLAFVKHELQLAGFGELECSVLDTVELSRIVFPGFDGYKLTELSEELQIRHENPHRADSDAEVTALIFLHMMDRLKRLPLPVLKSIRRLSWHLISDAQELFDGLIAEKGADAELEAGFMKVGSFVIRTPEGEDEEVGHKSRVSQTEPLIWEKDGGLSSLDDRFDKREGQTKMMREVWTAFQNHEHALIEAATGIGKTLGYLVPAAIHAKQTGKPVVISTYTTLLQQQMINRDIPLLEKIFPFPVKAAVLKGRSHYLSIRKFKHILQEDDDNYDSVLAKAQILVWLTDTETGDLSEINLPSGGKLLWDRLAYDSHSYAENSSIRKLCFYERAKARAQKADMIITNHALLLTDEANQRIQTGDADTFVIDEAHHFERAAGEQYGARADYVFLHKRLMRLGTLKQRGILKKAERLYRSAGISSESFFQMDEWLAQLLEESDLFFTAVHSFVKRRKPRNDLNRLLYKIGETGESRAWNRLEEGARRLCSMLYDMHRLFTDQKKSLAEKQASFTSRQAFLLDEYDSCINDLEEYRKTLGRLMFDPVEDEVVWIEIDAKGAKNAAAIYAQPLDTGEILADRFFTEKKSVVLTSGTLVVENSFGYMIKKLGLSDFYPRTLQIESPFSYDKHMNIMIPTDVSPIQNDPGDYIQDVTRYVKALAKQKNAKVLVLFTSHDMLRDVYHTIKNEEDFPCQLLAQGISGGSPVKVMKLFKSYPHAVLLGTNHFWEGVDFPGDELTTLIIARLPFRPPDHPVESAKCDRAKRRGESPFQAVSLPEAVLAFRQGIGRLLRSEKDSGTVVILDRRIRTSSYGTVFMKALPPAKVMEPTFLELEAYIAGLNG
ncbi:ATP-dependent DNA helicase DinG [Bacillus haynesii]|uniref:ATP-dependent DNA helicase DinG n=1 Tax=Bacillus haynesii TaxID=1925021 RepID=UPI00227F9D5F|nr:ATP-dependent DNA helicase DinG [Bacillus haynesii]MCY8006622.1 ATP-dependent DNA helicase DinG [Bacillus haynesii]MCY8066805.1 ATP-dependent DNA helicase DinG [Bacillus haynesii]MCY9339345.1 ATP-dependent DNA helicase DinG [Bacillus haynesii]